MHFSDKVRHLVGGRCVNWQAALHMMKQLYFWDDESEAEPVTKKAIDGSVESSLSNQQSGVHEEVMDLFVNVDRQFDFAGKPHEQWPAPEVNRSSISVDRIYNDIDGPAHRFEIHRHDYVEVFFGKDELRYGHVAGISHKRQQVRIAFEHTDEETWFDTACIYPAVEHKPKQSPSRKIIEQVSESLQAPSVQEQVARRLQKQTQYTSLKIVSLVRIGSMKGRAKLSSTTEACACFRQYWMENPSPDQERFVVAYLDTKHVVQSVVVITQGTLDATLVHPREVYKPAMIEGSSEICLSHNHPSGDPTPSREDHAVNERLTEAGKLIGINVLDHIVFADGTNEVVSLRES